MNQYKVSLILNNLRNAGFTKISELKEWALNSFDGDLGNTLKEFEISQGEMIDFCDYLDKIIMDSQIIKFDVSKLDDTVFFTPEDIVVYRAVQIMNGKRKEDIEDVDKIIRNWCNNPE